MDEGTAKTTLELIINHLTAFGVEFVVIGGCAEMLYGSSRVTYDTDLCYRRTPDNLRRLAEALKELKPALRGAPADLPFRLDAEALALGSNYTFDTPLGPLDLHGHVEPLGDYEQLVRNAEIVRFGEIDLKVIGLEDLIRIKEYLRRPKDRDSLMHLRAIQRVRKEQAAT